MKTCKDCGARKPLDGFYKHPQMADGRLNKCKKCVKARVKRYAAENSDVIKEKDRERDKLPHRVEARRAYQKTEAGKAAMARANKAWQDRNALKRAAHIIAGNAIRDGKLVKQPCEECGAKKVEAHHEDYERPLDVIWLCRKHHIARHKDP